VEEGVDALSEVRGKAISNAISERIIDRYNSVKGLMDHANNRHCFIVNRGWRADDREEEND